MQHRQKAWLEHILNTNKSTMKTNLFTYAAAILASTVSVTNAQSVSSSGHQTSPAGTVYVCKGGSVSLTASGWKKDPPPGPCCDSQGNSGTWALQSSTYSWSGDASGTSQNSTLNTSSEGDKSASCTATHTWKCSATQATTTTTEIAAMNSPSSIVVKVNSTDPCTPTQPNGTVVGIPGTKQVTNSKTIHQISYPWLTEEWWTGTWSNVKGTETFAANGNPIIRPCGKEWSEQKNSITASVGIGYGVFSFSLNFTGPNANANVAAEEFKRIYGQWWEYKINSTAADFSGTGDRKVTMLGNGQSSWLNNQNRNGTYNTTGATVQAGWDYSYCKVDCCPTN